MPQVPSHRTAWYSINRNYRAKGQVTTVHEECNITNGVVRRSRLGESDSLQFNASDTSDILPSYEPLRNEQRNTTIVLELRPTRRKHSTLFFERRPRHILPLFKFKSQPPAESHALCVAPTSEKAIAKLLLFRVSILSHLLTAGDSPTF